ncbi:hypothetical protein HMPREF1138_0127 [Actinomyces sp. ICM58]|nr:hypothetical protein HMPREF1138_0127 [Actinomyces sp. ICM58]
MGAVPRPLQGLRVEFFERGLSQDGGQVGGLGLLGVGVCVPEGVGDVLGLLAGFRRGAHRA